MIYATILICSAAFDPCTEDHAYRSFKGDRYLNLNACLAASLQASPDVPHNPNDTYRIVCGGRWLDLGKEA